MAQRPAIQLEDDGSVPSLGPSVDKYLAAHGYNLGAIHQIEHAMNSSHNALQFIGYLHPRGMPWTEAEYLWDLVRDDAE
jgi:hypothetical protein